MSYPAPTVQTFNRAMTSALGSRFEGLEKLPEGVLLAERDRHGSWGPVGAYYAYCHRCQWWFNFTDACNHICKGEHWNKRLANAAEKWTQEIEQQRTRIRNGLDPYYDGIVDLRTKPLCNGYEVPLLLAGRRQCLHIPCKNLLSPLQVMIDLPALQPDDSPDAKSLKVLVYFHGHGAEDCRTAPTSVPGCAVIAAQCPPLLSEGLRCFWFQEGPGGAWDRHEHEKMRRSTIMLEAMSHVLDASLPMFEHLGFDLGDRRLRVMGVSMGGCAALEFAHVYPGRIRCLACVAGYYPEALVDDLVDTIASIPLLLVHRKSDYACPFRFVQKLQVAREVLRDSGDKRAAGIESEAWFSEGDRHGPDDAEIEAVKSWLVTR